MRRILPDAKQSWWKRRGGSAKMADREERRMAFGERLQELRRARGMTQEDFAAQLKVSRQAVS